MSDNKLSFIPDNAITEISKKAYDDVAHPVLSEIGISAQGILKFVALPFKFLVLTADQLELKYKSFIEKAIKQVPPERLTEPSPAIIAPLLEHAKYVFDEPELAQMFSNLLSSSMDVEYLQDVHPSYVERVKQMSKFDAKVLNHIYNNKVSHIEMLLFSSIDVSIDIKNSPPFYSLEDSFNNVESFDSDPNRVRFSIDLLESFGLITTKLISSMNQEEYEKAVADYYYKKSESANTPIINKYIELCKNKYPKELTQEDTEENINDVFFAHEFGEYMEETLRSHLSLEGDKPIKKYIEDGTDDICLKLKCDRTKIRFTDYGDSFLYCCFYES